MAVESGAGKTVVLASADAELRHRLRDSLAGMRWKVREAAGGAEAMAQMEELQPEALVMDSWLPDLEASEFAGQVPMMYLFSGTSGAEPYANDTTQTPVAMYSGDASQQISVTPTGQKLVTGMAGSAIFSASGADVLKTLNALVADFSSGTVSASATDDLNELRAGLTNVSAQRSVLDASLKTLQSTSTYATTEETQLKASQTSLVSADTAKIATELSTNETQQQALIAVMSSEGKYSLFGYMQ